MQSPVVGVIGAGRVGAVLATRFRSAGHPVVVSGSSDASLLRFETLLPGVDVLDPREVARRADIVAICVPDSHIASVVASIVDCVSAGTTVFHTSGAHGRTILAPLEAQGARTLALHPAMTFTGTGLDLERSCVFGVTVLDSDLDTAATLIEELGGSINRIAEDDRVKYHAALAHGANHLVTIVAQSMSQLRAIGVDDPAAVLRPLLSAALDNTLAFGDAALTGPVARGDIATVESHLAAIDDPTMRRTYTALAEATAEHANLDEATRQRIVQALIQGAR
jgi:predicted short-subunit dehydrogenase-like oxidoreductase (DUF2520 family)